MIAKLLIKELEVEMLTTQKMLKLVPADKLQWKPHPKSMSMEKLAGHITEIGGWFKFCLEVEEVDFGLDPWESPKAKNGEGYAKIAKELTEGSLAALQGVSDSTLLNKRWIMKFHGETIMDFSKYEALRHSMSQMIHHRAQLGVFLRLLDIPIPGSYGPSADEM